MGVRNIVFILLFLSFIRAFAQSYNAEVLNYECNISIRNGTLYENESYKIRINNRSGDEYTEVGIPYSRLYKVSKIEAWLEDAFGNVIKRLKPGDISDVSAVSDMSLYEDDRGKIFTLKHNIYPYTLCYKYQTQRDQFLNIARWSPVLDTDIPTVKASLSLEIPRGYKILFAEMGVGSPVVDSGSVIKYTWNASYSEIIEDEIHSPPFDDLIPQVNIVPDEFKYEIAGSFNNWTAFGNWIHNLIVDLEDLPFAEKDKLLAMIKDTPGTAEKIKKLYHYLQDQTRYINVTVETGGFKPYPASYVSQNKYGDCKALSNYFKSILHAAGINSYYSIIYAGDLIDKIERKLPSQQFNHVILCVPLEKDTMWLDCTSDGPFDHAGTFIQNRDVFVIDKNNSHFSRTPALSKDDVMEIRKVIVKPDQNNLAIAEFSNTYKGEWYEDLFSLLNNVGETDRYRKLTEMFSYNGFQVFDHNLIPPDRDSMKISVKYSAKSGKIYHSYGNEVLIPMIPFSVPDFKEPKERKLPVQIDYPIYQVDTIEYSFPHGYTLSNKPEDQNIVSEFGEYKIQFKPNNSAVMVIKSFLLNAGDYDNEAYTAFYAFIKKVKDIEKNTYVVTNKTP